MKCLSPVLIRNNRFTDNRVHYIPVPCGKCIACRVNRSEELAGRIMYEFEIAVKNRLNCYFLTLTYDDDHLPDGQKFCRFHTREFLKRYRYYDKSFRYFLCAEYGGKFERQHYHVFLITNVSDKDIYEIINKCWRNGIAFWKHCHKRSPKYISKYVVKYDDREFADKPFVSMSHNFGVQPTSDVISHVHALGLDDKPLVYKDVLGSRHPYPRKVVGKSFSYSEKEKRSFDSFVEERLRSLHRKLQPNLSFEEFRVWYDNYLSDNQEKNFFKKLHYKK